MTMIGQRHLQALRDTSPDPTREIRWSLIYVLGRHIQELDAHAMMEIKRSSYEVPDHVAWIVRRVIGRTMVAHRHGLHRVSESERAILKTQNLPAIGRLAFREDEELGGIFF